MRVAIVGCGNIAERYGEAVRATPQLELVAATDLDPERAKRIVEVNGGVAYPTLEELLADTQVETVINLTIATAHVAVTRAALEAGKHVHTEKPLALRHEDARALVEFAEKRGVRLSAAPSTLLGEAQQSAWKLVRDGAIGQVRVVYAEANWGRLETWHPDPRGLYEVGPLVDVGAYPLTILTAMFGPVRHVQAYAVTLAPDRVHRDGWSFTLGAPDWVTATMEHEGGVVARLTATFWVPASKQRGLELHGDAGSLFLATWAEFDSRLELRRLGAGEYEPIGLLREPYHGIDWSRALLDLADAIEHDRSHRSTGEHAAHVVEVLEAAAASAADGGRSVAVHSSFGQPEPVDWAR